MMRTVLVSKVGWVSLLLAVALVSQALGQGASMVPFKEDLNEGVLWMDEERSTALFVPERLLNELPKGSVPISSHCAAALESNTSAGPASLFDEERRARMAGGPPSWGEPGKPDLKAFVARWSERFVAVVKETELGWDCTTPAVATRYILAVERSICGTAQAGEEISFLAIGGDIEVHGRLVASFKQTFLPPLELGDRVLFLGEPHSYADERARDFRGLLRIKGDQIEPFPVASMSAFAPTALSEIAEQECPARTDEE